MLWNVQIIFEKEGKQVPGEILSYITEALKPDIYPDIAIKFAMIEPEDIDWKKGIKNEKMS